MAICHDLVVLSTCCIASGLASLAQGAVINIDDGETLTNTDMMAGSFMGQAFTVDSDTTFRVNSGGTLGPIGTPIIPPDPAIPFDMNGAQIKVRDGGYFAGRAINNMNATIRTGGTLAPFVLANTSVLSVRGGDVGHEYSNNGGTVNLYEGHIGDGYKANPGSVTNVRGGSIGNGFFTNGLSFVNISGGTVGTDYFARFGNRTTISGGSIGDFFRVPGGRVTMSGGSFDNRVLVYSGGRMTLCVASATIDGVPVALTENATAITTRGGATLVVTFADGGTEDFKLNADLVFGQDLFENGALYIKQIPTPGTSGLVVGAMLLGGVRRRR